MKVQYDGYYGIQSVSKKLSMMNAYQFAEFAKMGMTTLIWMLIPVDHRMTRMECVPNSWERIPTNSFLI